MTEPAAVAPPPPVRSRRGLVVGATATVLAVVAGAAVYATTRLSGGGPQPEDVVPRSTFAFVKVDLDPAAGQKLAARSFFAKVPDLKREGDEDDVFEDVVAGVVDGDDVDYDTDVKPWFDKRAGVAAFPGGSGETNVVAVLRSKDDGKARASLDAVIARAEGEDLAYRISDGYAVLGAEEAVAEAVSGAAKGTLRGNETYRKDVDRLDGDQVAVAWADLAGTYDAIEGAFPVVGLLPGLLTAQVEGRLVAGVHLTGDYAEVKGLALGTSDRLAGRLTDHALLRSLPASTALGVSFGGAGDALGGPLAGLGLDALLGQVLGGTGLSFADDLLPLLGGETVLAAAPWAGGLGSLRAGLVTKVSDGSKVAAVTEKVTGLLGLAGVPVDAEVDGDRFVLATPPDYTAELAGRAGGLGASDRFEEAMGDLEGTTFALYADVPAIRPALGLVAPVPDGLTALGVVTGRLDGESFFRLRMVAG